MGARVFHVTSKGNLGAIFKDGLQPLTGARSHECGEHQPAVFCFPSRDDCDNALSNWLGEQFEDVPANGLAIIELFLPKDASTISEVGYEIACLTTIPPECIVAVYHEDWSRDQSDYRQKIHQERQKRPFPNG